MRLLICAALAVTMAACADDGAGQPTAKIGPLPQESPRRPTSPLMESLIADRDALNVEYNRTIERAPAVCAALHPQRADASAAESARARTLAQDCYDAREREAADRRRNGTDRLWDFYLRSRR